MENSYNKRVLLTASDDEVSKGTVYHLVKFECSVAVQSNMESEFESSINGGPTSSTAGLDIFDDKSLNGSDTGTGLKTTKLDASPIRKGRKRVVSGRSRGRRESYS